MSHLLQEGRCHSIPTQFAAQLRHTSMQLSRSAGELSLENIAISISGGRRPIGGTTAFWTLFTLRSRKVATPTEDCESLAWAMKKSVSSSAARSGDVEDDDSEGASLGNRAAGRERSITNSRQTWNRINCLPAYAQPSKFHIQCHLSGTDGEIMGVSQEGPFLKSQRSGTSSGFEDRRFRCSRKE